MSSTRDTEAQLPEERQCSSSSRFTDPISFCRSQARSEGHYASRFQFLGKSAEAEAMKKGSEKVRSSYMWRLPY